MNRTVEISIKDNKYTVSFPTVGQIIDIETKRSILSRGQYGSMIESKMQMSWNVLEIIDIMSYFQVLLPKLFDDLNVKSLEELDAIDFAEVVEAYREQFFPWYDGWAKKFNEVMRKSK